MISQSNLLSILGENIDSTVMKQFKSCLSGPLREDETPLPGERYFYSFDDGLSLLLEDEKVSAIHLYCTGNEDGYSSYKGWIGDKLKNKDIDPIEVISLMGKPSNRGGGAKGFLGKTDPTWLRYDYLNYVIHYTFSSSNTQIEMVTLMDPQTAP
jgi:hypothetical protein